MQSSIELHVFNYVDVTQNHRRPNLGVTSMGGLPGRQIVVMTDDSPASFSWYRVVRSVHHRLELVQPPPHQRWFVGATAAGGGEGYACKAGLLTHVADGPGHLDAAGNVSFKQTRASYRWSRRGWLLVAQTVRRGSVVSGAWRCPGLGYI